MPRPIPDQLYLIPVLSKALDIVELLQNQHTSLPLEVIYQRTAIPKTTVYRILQTLVHRGYVARSQGGLYRLVGRPKKARFGFGCQSSEMDFSEAVTRSLRSAASAAGVELIVLDNRHDAAASVKNADEFVQNRPDLVIEFRVEQQVAPVIADKIDSAGIPMIAVDFPYPHATFFGVDNYRVGFEAGACLAENATQAWGGRVSWSLGLDGVHQSLICSRVTGAFEAIRAVLPDLPQKCFIRVNDDGGSDQSYRLVTDFLLQHSRERRVLVAAATDTSALGAVQAIREQKREKDVAVVGQGCITEAIKEMRLPGSPLIASVSHDASSYGPKLIALGLAILNGKQVEPYNYVDHKLVTAQTVRNGN